MSTYAELREQQKSLLKRATDITDRAQAEKRDVMPTELTEFNGYLEQAKALKPQVEKAREDEIRADERQRITHPDDFRAKQRQADQEFKSFLSELGSSLGGSDDLTGGFSDPVAAQQAGFVGRSGGASVKDRAHGSSWAKSVATQMMATARSSGVKALTTGSIDVPSPVQVDVVAKPHLPRVVDLLVNRRRLDANTFEFLRQTVRTNNAAPVADGGTKPTSIFTVVPIEDRARVIAHLSEPFPERYLADYANLVRFLDDEMREGVLQALEAQIISGSGTGENMAGIMNTSGTQVVAWNTNIFTTIRKARTAMQVLGETPNAWVMHPSDLETVDLTTDDANRYYLTGGGGDGKVDALFGGLPRIPSTGVPAGTAILGDFTQAELYVREDVRLDADRSGTLFDTNQVKLRAEGRFGFAVLRPQAFAEVDLTAA